MLRGGLIDSPALAREMLHSRIPLSVHLFCYLDRGAGHKVAADPGDGRGDCEAIDVKRVWVPATAKAEGRISVRKQRHGLNRCRHRATRG
jgi:hypothetical protein